jgi:hypothetical protein
VEQRRASAENLRLRRPATDETYSRLNLRILRNARSVNPFEVRFTPDSDRIVDILDGHFGPQAVIPTSRKGTKRTLGG